MPPRRGRTSGSRSSTPASTRRAEEQFSRALEENPTFPDLRYYRARIFQRSGRLHEAVAELERALAEHPRYVEALLLLAVCQFAARRPRRLGPAR